MNKKNTIIKMKSKLNRDVLKKYTYEDKYEICPICKEYFKLVKENEEYCSYNCATGG